MSKVLCDLHFADGDPEAEGEGHSAGRELEQNPAFWLQNWFAVTLCVPQPGRTAEEHLRKEGRTQENSGGCGHRAGL